MLDVEPRGPTAQSDDASWVLPPHETRWDPFVLWSEDVFSTRGFPWHPHRGFQTLTFVLDGELEHRDNAGGFGVLGAGDAQYMAAGRYAMHYELAHEFRPVRTLQAWINLPASEKLGPTSYIDLRAESATRIERDGARARLHVGDFLVELSVLDVELDAGARFVHELPGAHSVAALVLDGAVEMGPDRTSVSRRQTAWFDAGQDGASELELSATEASRVLVYSGRPVGEPVVFGGPWLMNTQREAEEAFADYRAGEFGPIPDDPTPTDARTREQTRG